MINGTKYKKLHFISLIVLILPIINVTISSVNYTGSTPINTLRTHHSLLTSSMTGSEGPTIGSPTINPFDPGSGEDTIVTVSIDDVDGVRNASLNWEYTVNGTQGSANMTTGSELLARATDFTADEPGETADSGIYDNDRKYGNYSFVASGDNIINKINVNITKGNDKNNLTFVKIELKNSSTGSWEIETEDGTIESTTDLDPTDQGLNYLVTKTVSGVRIYIIAHKGDHQVATVPNLDLSIYRLSYQGVIPAANQPTYVNYNITAFDLLNNSATSGPFTFLMDWSPTVTIHDKPDALPPNQDFVLNVSVSDNDGVADINDSSVIAYYSLVGETDWNSVNLTWIFDDFDKITAYYNCTIPTSSIVNMETDLTIMINASDQLGREGTSGNNTIVIDNLNPRVTNILIEGGVTVPGLVNVSLAFSEVNITAMFYDPAGVSNVSIYYSIPNGTIPLKKEMTNISLNEFFVTLPPANQTSYVEYFFETLDYLGNSGNTSVNVYYADSSPPILETLINYPLFISNITDTTILFNATDYTGIENIQAIVWYSFDGGTSWRSSDASLINYANQVDYQQTLSFDPEQLPFLIRDNATTNLSLEVIRGSRIDSAILTVEFTHELSSDLRIWLTLDDDRRFLIFDRETVSINHQFTVDLIALGLGESDFDSQNFTLEIQDFSDLYSGRIELFEIELKHHNIPLGYQFMATIEKTRNDTTVLFYITLTDALENAENTSTFSYYSDGLAPNISVQLLSSPLDLAKKSTIKIEAGVTDIGGVMGVEIYYKFTESDEWIIANMVFDSENNRYVFDIPIPTTNGTLIYKIRAFDFVGLSSETSVYTLEFINGRVERPGLDIGPIIIIGGLTIILGSGVAVSLYFIRKKFFSQSTELSESADTTDSNG